jgi:lysophospholipase L1-like esterase
MNKMTLLAAALFLTLLVPNRCAADAPKTNLVVCLGDSITHRGYPEELAKMLPIRVINAGVNGNTSRQGLARLQKDVLSHKPDAVVLFFGTNDNRQDAPKVHVSLAEYEQNLATIIDRCRGVGAKVILGTLPPIDPKPYFERHEKEKFDAVGGLQKLVSEYRNAALKIGKAKNVPVVDLNQLLAKDTSWRSSDGVHPTEEGNRVIAEQFAGTVARELGLKRSGNIP